MIEVEKKFILSELQKEKLLEGAEFVSEKTFTDVYYDTKELNLAQQDIWLRSRENNFELKIPMHQSEGKLIDQYEEVEGEEMIRGLFALPKIKTFVEDIADFGYEPYCICRTTRRKFKKDEFIIDIDSVEYDDFSYAIGEIELMVEEKSQIAEAVKKIENFAAKNGLEIAPVRGKVIEYLKRKKPEQYRILFEAGILKGDEY